MTAVALFNMENLTAQVQVQVSLLGEGAAVLTLAALPKASVCKKTFPGLGLLVAVPRTPPKTWVAKEHPLLGKLPKLRTTR